jgi:hypothetical protein
MATPYQLSFNCKCKNGQSKIKSSYEVSDNLLSECSFLWQESLGGFFTVPFGLIYAFASHFEGPALIILVSRIKNTAKSISAYDSWHQSVLVESHGFYNEAILELANAGVYGPEQVRPNESYFRFDQEVLNLALPYLKNVVFRTDEGFSWQVSDVKTLSKSVEFYCNVLSVQKHKLDQFFVD